MTVIDSNTVYKILALKNAYRAMVASRTRTSRCFVVVDDTVVEPIAAELESASLAQLFIKAQFHAMPPEWCTERFKRRYPPVNVVFGGECWRRYKEYSDRGIDDAR